jgi:hypothetical protein
MRAQQNAELRREARAPQGTKRKPIDITASWSLQIIAGRKYNSGIRTRYACRRLIANCRSPDHSARTSKSRSEAENLELASLLSRSPAHPPLSADSDACPGAGYARARRAHARWIVISRDILPVRSAAALILSLPDNLGSPNVESWWLRERRFYFFCPYIILEHAQITVPLTSCAQLIRFRGAGQSPTLQIGSLLTHSNQILFVWAICVHVKVHTPTNACA